MSNLTPPLASRTNEENAVCHLIDDNTPLADGNRNSTCRGPNDQSAENATAVIELQVRNHPGTMSHITGLFARRGFNLEAIVCVPVADGATSCMLLLVADELRLEQVERQLAKLYDVLALRHRPDLTPEFFTRLIQPSPNGQSPHP